MYLTRQEEKMLSGEMGEPVATAMRLLVTLGDVFGAKRMIHISSAHISGVSYQNIGDPGLDFLEGLAAAGGKMRSKATINPAAMDRNRWREVGVPPAFAAKQLRILRALEAMGGGADCTCTPYFSCNKPGLGVHVAWSESSAVIYANSVLGARTNRESGMSALASALTGRTPLWGFHEAEARMPTLTVSVQTNLSGHLAYSALGYLVAQEFNHAVPYFQGLQRPSADELKALAAGLGAAGAVTLYHAQGATPETTSVTRRSLAECEHFTVEAKQIRKVIEKLSEGDDYDGIVLGCPQLSLEQIASAAKALKGRKASRRLLLCTSRDAYTRAAHQGFVAVVEKAGGTVLCDTCAEVCPLKEMGFSSILTDSCKAAQYVPSVGRVKVGLKTTEECLREALDG